MQKHLIPLKKKEIETSGLLGLYCDKFYLLKAQRWWSTIKWSCASRDGHLSTASTPVTQGGVGWGGLLACEKLTPTLQIFPGSVSWVLFYHSSVYVICLDSTISSVFSLYYTPVAKTYASAPHRHTDTHTHTHTHFLFLATFHQEYFSVSCPPDDPTYTSTLSWNISFSVKQFGHSIILLLQVKLILPSLFLLTAIM